MPNFKVLLNGCLSLLLVGCLDLPKEEFFSSTTVNQKSHEVEYQAIHKLNLAITELVKEVDETGFSPKLKSQFKLNNLNGGPWPQAWVAFNIEVHFKGKQLASISKANVLQNHSLVISFEQHLPKFGIGQEDIDIRVSPVAWMPTFPLQIMTDEASNKAVLNIETEKNKISALP